MPGVSASSFILYETLYNNDAPQKNHSSPVPRPISVCLRGVEAISTITINYLNMHEPEEQHPVEPHIILSPATPSNVDLYARNVSSGSWLTRPIRVVRYPHL